MVASLTERELELARLVVDRKTNPQIAAELFLSQKTVETHLREHLPQGRRDLPRRARPRSRAGRPRPRLTKAKRNASIASARSWPARCRVT